MNNFTTEHPNFDMYLLEPDDRVKMQLSIKLFNKVSNPSLNMKLIGQTIWLSWNINGDNFPLLCEVIGVNHTMGEQTPDAIECRSGLGRVVFPDNVVWRAWLEQWDRVTQSVVMHHE